MRRKPTLRAHAALLNGVLARLASALCDPVGSLVDASDHLLLAFKLRELRCDDTKYDVLVLGEVSKRLEATGTRRIVFEVVGVDIEVLWWLVTFLHRIDLLTYLEQLLCDIVVGTL